MTASGLDELGRGAAGLVEQLTSPAGILVAVAVVIVLVFATRRRK